VKTQVALEEYFCWLQLKWQVVLRNFTLQNHFNPSLAYHKLYFTHTMVITSKFWPQWTHVAYHYLSSWSL